MGAPDDATLDPFALPAQTTARFWLLVVATLASGNTLAMLNFSVFPTTLERVAPTLTLTQSLLSMAAVAAGALVIWWAYPWVKIRRWDLQPLPAPVRAELGPALDEMCAGAGLARQPRFLWSPLRAAPAAAAFGRLRTLYVGLSGGLVVEFRRDPPAFRAIVLHELAHLRNRDVAITYFAMALWWSFVAIVLVPFLLFVLLPEVLRPKLFSRQAWLTAWPPPIAALTLLVYLTRNSVLRTREVYADIRAASWDESGALGRVLERLPRPRRWRWLSALAVHPDPARRRRLLDDAAPLFKIGILEALVTGCTLGIANEGLVGRTALLTHNLGLVITAELLDGLVVSCVAAGVLGLGLWREAYSAGGRRSRAWAGVAFGLAAGLVLGPNLSLDAPVFVLTGQARLAGLRPALPDVLVDLLVLVGALLVARWIADTSRAWLVWRLQGTRPGLAYTGGLLATGLVLASLVVPAYLAMLLAGTGSISTSLEFVLYVAAVTPVGTTVVTCLWAFPLAAEIQGGAPGPRRELLAGLGLGAAFWPLYLVDVLVVRPPGPLTSLALAVAVLQAVVGVVVAHSARRPAVPRALLAAFVAGVVTLPLGLVVLPRPTPLEIVVAISAWLTLGTLVAYPFALLGSGVRRAAGGPGAAGDPPANRPSGFR